MTKTTINCEFCSDWDRLLALARGKRERTVLGRLAHHCRKEGYGPNFGMAERNQLLERTAAAIADGEAMINVGLKALAKIATRHPHLNLAPCPRFLTQREIHTANALAANGTRFEADIATYVTIESTPTDRHGRKRRVIPSIAEKHPQALRRCLRICRDAKVEVNCLADLLSRASRDAVIASYGDPKVASGGRKRLLSTLKHVALHCGNEAALEDLERQASHLGKINDALPLARLQSLAPYHHAGRRDDMLAQLAKVTATIADGWPRNKALLRLQASLDLLLAYYLIATPQFVYSLRFGSDPSARITHWGSRPVLIARSAPHEPIEVALPDKLIKLIDIYWHWMPPPLQDVGEIFITETATRINKSTLVKRLQLILFDFNVRLTPLGFVDLAVLDMIWDRKSLASMTAKSRFTSERAFLKRYSILMDDIETQRRRLNKRPGEARQK